MYRAVYEFKKGGDGTLSFTEGATFNLLEQVDDHWWSVVEENGTSGLVPASYLKINNVSKDEVILSLDRSIQGIRKTSSNKLVDTRNIQKLNKNKELILQGDSLWAKENPPAQPSRLAPKIPSQRASVKGKSPKRYSAPPPPTTLSGGSQHQPGGGIATTLKSPAPSSPAARIEEPLTPGSATSSVYSLEIKKGDISPLSVRDVNKIPLCAQQTPERQNSLEASNNPRDRRNSTDTSRRSSTDTSRRSSTETSRRGSTDMSRRSSTDTPSRQSSTDTNRRNSKDMARQNSLEESARREALETCKQKITLKVTKSESERKCPIDNSLTNQIKEMNLTEPIVPEGVGKMIVDDLRDKCHLSFDKSLTALHCVIDNLSTEVPGLQALMKVLKAQIQEDNLNVMEGHLAEEDVNRFTKVLDGLVGHIDDSQQRNWAVHEDFTQIHSLLQQLLSLFDDVHADICGKVLKDDEFKYAHQIVLYYQMETRSELRMTTIHVLGCICQLGEEFISQLLCSVLPSELLAALTAQLNDTMSFLSTSLMLRMVLSTGETLPYQHYNVFNERFVTFLLDTIEQPPDSDVEDQYPDSLVALLLAFNKHFKVVKENTVIKVMAKRSNFRTFTEKLLVLLNRETDPVELFPFCRSCPDAVVKLLIDVFSTRATSNIFYTNDIQVLIDIVLRQVADRCANDPARTEYLSLFHTILNTSEYPHMRRHADDFRRHFSAILENAATESEVDVYICREVMNRFKDVFE